MGAEEIEPLNEDDERILDIVFARLIAERRIALSALAAKLAAHPSWRWEIGMLVHMDGKDIPWELGAIGGVPALGDPATVELLCKQVVAMGKVCAADACNREVAEAWLAVWEEE